MEKPLTEQCPTCYHDLRASLIPNTNPPEYYSQIIGIEIRGVYDGVLFWECPYCEDRFHRFRTGTDLWRKAAPYVQRLPIEEVKNLEPLKKEKMSLGDEYLVNVHNMAYCDGEFCAIHNPSEHPLNKSPRRFENGIILRICPHGVYHPDPDALHWAERTFGRATALSRGQHGCCGAQCCRVPAIDT